VSISKHLVIIDGHHLMYRAYWAIPRTLKTSTGEQNNAVFGVASMLLSILSKEEPDALVMCFDAGDETFRHQEHEEYKEGRAETPDDFYEQIPRILELVSAFSFVEVSNPDYEADDFLGSYAVAAEREGMKVTIVTGDKDALQLATGKIQIAIPHKGYQQAEYLGPEEIEVKYGIRPDQVASYKGLCGDQSDNLPGVHGIGPKTASKLLQEFGSLEGIYAALSDVKSSVRQKLEESRDDAFFCQRMAELVCDIPVRYSLKDIELKEISSVPVFNFFSEMEFSLLFKRFQKLLSTEYGKKHFQSDAPAVIEEKKETKKSQMTLF